MGECVFDPFWIRLGICLGIRFSPSPGGTPKRICKRIPKQIRNGSKTDRQTDPKRIKSASPSREAWFGDPPQGPSGGPFGVRWGIRWRICFGSVCRASRAGACWVGSQKHLPKRIENGSPNGSKTDSKRIPKRIFGKYSISRVSRQQIFTTVRQTPQQSWLLDSQTESC